MRLYDEIFKNTDGMALQRCTIVPGGEGYFEGVKAVEDFSSEQIIVCFPKETVIVDGQQLAIRKYCDGDLRISGKIFSLRLADEPPSKKR